jgi:predicted O-methyltransferase YrrM
MSYVGFIRTICQDFLAGFEEPNVLEIGIDKGQTALPLIHNMSQFKGYTYTGIDIKVRKLLIEQLSQCAGVSLGGLDERNGRDVLLMEINSLEWLKATQSRKSKYDLVLIDGDHNYKTVLEELELVQGVIHPMTLIVCDDYNGRWSEKDLYYSSRESYKENSLATPSEVSEKQGVRTAVDEFVKNNKDWSCITLGDFDPAFLYRSDVWDICQFVRTGDQPAGYGRLSKYAHLEMKVK